MRLGGSQIGELLSRHGLEPSRALGQNFVTDPNTIDRIVRLAGIGPGDHVVEVGPGLGSLTVGLLDAGAKVVALELDRHLEAPLREVIAGCGPDAAGRAEVVIADAMTVDWDAMLRARGDQRWKLVANLPYNVAAPMVLSVLDDGHAVDELLVMVQREVGERLAAAPGGAAYGIPSVKVSYWATASVVGRVPASVFHPVPRVDSVLVRIVRRSQPATSADPTVLFGLVRRAFGQRRKMLRRSLAGVVSEESFAAAGIDPARRPQELGIAEWGDLAHAVGS